MGIQCVEMTKNGRQFTLCKFIYCFRALIAARQCCLHIKVNYINKTALSL